MNQIKVFCLILGSLLVSGCTGKPSNVEPVSPFALDQYLGTWYEIARLDHSFERGLNKITATYALNDDGSVNVLNRGWNEKEQQWSEAVGKAKFVDSSDQGYLKVSFFGPFYGSYIVFHLEPDYSTALISGPNLDYFWILSRTPTLEAEQLNRYKEIAQQAGFDTEQLIYPTHD
ncbi:lipoprotein Blc [Vibrio astriarenae]|uniref:Outer membrane lipoprotein Blc n=1 Tax=Vibrio astriarenae TaxID=1481923 RepID=A0A7Z2YDS5_9VIBR|nr:lipocalin family protein [Vibrio astriarenae]QIA63647.1 lipocalin [Vibrio astriarenae]GAL15201.1 lipoprotein Blc [Vibrio sp. C7]